MKLIRKSLVFCIACTFSFYACGPSQKVHEKRIYLHGIDSLKGSTYKVPESIIQVGDMLSIKVYSDNPEATIIYNQSSSGSGAGSGGNVGSSSPAGYQVDVQGNIRFQSLGVVQVSGFTKLRLSALLQDSLSRYLTHPYVEVGFLNTRVTVMGEVIKPGVVSIPEQKLSILDALAQSGDVTVYGRKDNVLVVREQNGKRDIGRLNLNDPSIVNSPFFYLQQNDLVYVEPTRKKPLGTDQNLLRNITIITSVVSTLSILYTIFKR
jgi:polysaccharide biosynthesis/export protein